MKKLRILFPVVMVTCLVFSVSCVSKDVPVIETYYETEYRTEEYTDIENEERKDLGKPVVSWGSYYGYRIPVTEHSKAQIKITLTPVVSSDSIFFITVYDLVEMGQLLPYGQWTVADPIIMRGREVVFSEYWEIWFAKYNTILSGEEHRLYRAILDSYGDKYITVDVTGVEEFAVIASVHDFSGGTPQHKEYTRPIIEMIELIRFNEVAKERQVPYQVEKQRTVMQTKKVPFWEAVFR